jgi:lipopolysaccharide export LptBFGC system permease protein LptF
MDSKPADSDVGSIDNYVNMDDTELDEENINWVQLIVRILSGLLMLCIIIFFALGFLKNQKLLILSGIGGGILLLIFACSFGCAGYARKFCVSRYKTEFRSTDIEAATRNSLQQSFGDNNSSF